MVPISGSGVPTTGRTAREAPAGETPRAGGAPAEPEGSDRFAKADPIGLQPDPRKGWQQFQRPELIHPGTPSVFREPLEKIINGLPAGLLRAIGEEGYLIYVVDCEQQHPLTIEIQEPDLASFEPGSSLVEECLYESIEQLAQERGATTPEQVAELSELVRALNPELESGSEILVPAFHYWQQWRVSSGGAWEFLTQPLNSFVAGMVTHGPILGLRGSPNRVVFWDCAFARGDGLLDWYVMHELGHTADYTFAFRYPEAWRDWCARGQTALEAARAGGHLITRYAGDSLHEYIAEGFAAWARGSDVPIVVPPEFGPLAAQRGAMHHALLRKQDRALYDLLEEAVNTLRY